MSVSSSFGDTLAQRVAERSSQLVLGVDPDPRALWPESLERLPACLSGTEAAARAVLEHCRALIDATAEACVAVKLQLARFEALGAPGWGVASQVATHARERGLLIIADGKRGDIDVTAAAYAAALYSGLETPFGRLAGMGADLATVNPLMGRDAIEPFISAARAAGAGVLLLVRTSNPGARDVEDLTVQAHGEQPAGPLWERLALIAAELGAGGVGRSGLSDVGAVVGATEPRHLARARELMPHATFLLPGVGAQGGRVEDLRAAFAPGAGAGLVSASRTIADAHRTFGGTPPAAARQQAERLREQAASLFT